MDCEIELPGRQKKEKMMNVPHELDETLGDHMPNL